MAREETEEIKRYFHEEVEGVKHSFREEVEGVRRAFHEETKETKRHFGVVAEGLRSEIHLLAEGQDGLREQFDSMRQEFREFREEVREEFKEVRAMIRFSYAELDERLKSGTSFSSRRGSTSSSGARVSLFVALPALASVALASLLAAQLASAASTPVTALRAARMFDARSEKTVDNAIVLIEGGKIKDAGTGLAVPPGATVIDLGDATLLPGFIDSHTHVTSEASENWLADFYENLRRPVAEQALVAAGFAKKTLDSGFTTVRDVGSRDGIDVGLRNAINAGLVPGPRMLVAREGIGATGGHCDSNGFPPGTFGEEPGAKKGIVNGAEEARQAVRLNIKYGADVIKTCASGGVLSLNDDVSSPQLTDEELKALVDEAHRRGKKAAAHSHGDAAARAAVLAGIDSIEHGSFLSDATLALMKQKGTYLVPTLMAGEWTGGKAEKFPPMIAAKAKAALGARSDMFRRALKMGVRIAFGTDAGVSPHGLSGQEFGLMVGLGMTPAAALRSAGPAAADLLGFADRIGTIERGKDADIVAVPGDPLKDIRVTEKVFFVMKGGKVHKNERAR